MSERIKRWSREHVVTRLVVQIVHRVDWQKLRRLLHHDRNHSNDEKENGFYHNLNWERVKGFGSQLEVMSICEATRGTV